MPIPRFFFFFFFLLPLYDFIYLFIVFFLTQFCFTQLVTAANNEEDIHPIIQGFHSHESEIVREFAQTLEFFETNKHEDKGDTELEPNVLGAGIDQEGMTLTIANDRPVWSPALDFRPQMEKARGAYKINAGSYPASIHAPPPKEDNLSPFSIFNLGKLSSLGVLLTFMDTPIIGGNGNPAKKMSEFGKRPYAQPDDQYFVEQRVLGVNVCALTNISDEQLALVNRGLDEKLKNDKHDLYACDYAILKKSSKALNDADSKSYVPAPICVLRYNPGSHLPFTNVAILLDQENRYGDDVVVTPKENDPKWEFAKMCVRAADWNVHELGSHLTLCHLVSEVACLVTYRNLPKQHPIYQLLAPHFLKTLPLNVNAREVLVPRIIASRLTAFSKSQCNSFVTDTFSAWNFKEKYIPRDLENRGVKDMPLEAYPFATTATLVWDNVRSYVQKVINQLTAVDASRPLIGRDVLLAAWCTDMASRMKGFPEINEDVPNSEEVLIDALTMIIYTVSHQHSAVNYFQKRYLSYLPASPSKVNTKKNFDLQKLKKSDLPKLFPTPREGELMAKTVDMLSDAPEKETRLTEFKASASPKEHYQPWSTLAGDLVAMQHKMREELDRVERRVLKTAVSDRILAQSVLI